MINYIENHVFLVIKIRKNVKLIVALVLAGEENALGRFLKEHGKTDKTRAGKMMVAAGKTMSYTGQQRLSIRVPLVRLYQVSRVGEKNRF